MPLDLGNIEKCFRATIRELLSMPANSVKRANQFDPPPAGDQKTQFATVLIQQLGAMGWDEVTYENPSVADSGYGSGGAGEGGAGTGASEDVTEVITGQRHFLASVQFFRGDALVKANSLTALLQGSTAVSKLRAAGIGLGKIGTVRNFTTTVDSFFESRAQVDIEFNVISQEQTNLSTYDKFPVTFTTEDGEIQGDGFGQGGFGGVPPTT